MSSDSVCVPVYVRLCASSLPVDVHTMAARPSATLIEGREAAERQLVQVGEINMHVVGSSVVCGFLRMEGVGASTPL